MRLARLLLGDPDRRTPQQVCADIQDELAHHLECLERDLRAEGLREDEVQAEAARRFGDAARYRRACQRITLKERIMLQRINLFLLVLVTGAVSLVMWRSWSAEARTAEAVDRLARQLGAPQGRRSEPGAPGATGAPVATGATGVVYLAGAIQRPGVYAIPTGGLTLRRALASGGWDGEPIRVRLDRASERAPRRFDVGQVGDGDDVALVEADVLTVERAPDARPRP